MTRNEHLQWCKDRADEYLKAGDATNAWASMASDLGKHPDTVGHVGIKLGVMMMMSGRLSTVPEMRTFVEGFN